MATLVNVYFRTKKLVERQKINLLSLKKDIEEAYSKMWPLKLNDGTFRKWGLGPNESYDIFQRYVTLIVFGVYGPWPEDSISYIIRQKMAEYKTLKTEELDAYDWLKAEGQLERYLKIRGSRGENSPYQPPNLDQFIQSVVEGYKMDAEDAKYFYPALKYLAMAGSWKKAAAMAYRNFVLKQEYKCFGEEVNLLNRKEAENLLNKQSRVIQMRLWYHHGIAIPLKEITKLHKETEYWSPKSTEEKIIESKLKELGDEFPQHLYDVLTIGFHEFYRRYSRNLRAGWTPATSRFLAIHDNILGDWPPKIKRKVLNVVYEKKLNICSQWDLRTLAAKIMMEEFNQPADDKLINLLLSIRGGWKVKEWLLRKYNNPSMSKVRVVYGPAGATKTFCYLDIIDEVADDDIPHLDASPDVVFRNSARRLEQLYLAEMGEKVPLPVSPFGEAPELQIRQIKDSADLIREGKEMHHCVGGYVRSCLQGISYIYHVGPEAPKGVTVEVTPDGYIHQIFGEYDSMAPVDLKNRFITWLEKKIGRKPTISPRCG